MSGNFKVDDLLVIMKFLIYVINDFDAMYFVLNRSVVLLSAAEQRCRRVCSNENKLMVK